MMQQERGNPDGLDEQERDVLSPGRSAGLVRAYHQLSMHRPDRFAPGPQALDWDNQPDPVRRLEGCRLIPLWQRPHVESPLRDMVLAGPMDMPARLNAQSLSQLLYDSLACSARFEADGQQTAVRINPSSGNLHPTEAWLLLPPGVFGEHGLLAHYRPDEHALEVRAELPPALGELLLSHLPSQGFLLALSSIGWRESWKYGERGWRYCQLDIGHAQGALALAAGALRWQVRQLETLDECCLDTLFGLDRGDSAEHEQAECLLWVGPPQTASFELPSSLLRGMATLELDGEPQQLSEQSQEWPEQARMFELCRRPRQQAAPWVSVAGRRSHDSPPIPLRVLLHQRRSARSFDVSAGMSQRLFNETLLRIMPKNTPLALALDSCPPGVDLLLFVHRVQGMTPGLYWLDRTDSLRHQRHRGLSSSFAWEPCGDLELPLYRLQSGDARALAKQLACGQTLAADSSFSIAMLGRFDAALERGAWAYAALHRECGRIGQLLYLEAEALGMAATGIGSFQDSSVHEVLGLQDSRWQCLYFFAFGRGLPVLGYLQLPAYDSLRWPPEPQADPGL